MKLLSATTAFLIASNVFAGNGQTGSAFAGSSGSHTELAVGEHVLAVYDDGPGKLEHAADVVITAKYEQNSELKYMIKNPTVPEAGEIDYSPTKLYAARAGACADGATQKVCVGDAAVWVWKDAPAEKVTVVGIEAAPGKLLFAKRSTHVLLQLDGQVVTATVDSVHLAMK